VWASFGIIGKAVRFCKKGVECGYSFDQGIDTQRGQKDRTIEGNKQIYLSC
jgi:hypothetical protein